MLVNVRRLQMLCADVAFLLNILTLHSDVL